MNKKIGIKIFLLVFYETYFMLFNIKQLTLHQMPLIYSFFIFFFSQSSHSIHSHYTNYY